MLTDFVGKYFLTKFLTRFQPLGQLCKMINSRKCDSIWLIPMLLVRTRAGKFSPPSIVHQKDYRYTRVRISNEFFV